MSSTEWPTSNGSAREQQGQEERLEAYSDTYLSWQLPCRKLAEPDTLFRRGAGFLRIPHTAIHGSKQGFVTCPESTADISSLKRAAPAKLWASIVTTRSGLAIYTTSPSDSLLLTIAKFRDLELQFSPTVSGS